MSKAERDFLLFLEDMVESIERIEKYTKGMTLKRFLKTPMAVDAVIRNFEIIGEAVKKLPGTFKTKYSDVEWSEAAGFRDVLIHNYFGIDKEAEAVEISPGVNMELDDSGELIGVEIFRASHRFRDVIKRMEKRLHAA